MEKNGFRGVKMLKKKRMYLVGLLCLGLMGYTVEAEQIETQLLEVQEEQEFIETFDESQEMDQTEPVTQVWDMEKELQEMLQIDPVRFESFVTQEHVISQNDFARMLCYALKLSPIYTQLPEEDPYITALKQVNIWSDMIPQQITEFDQTIIEACLKRVQEYQLKQIETRFFKPAPLGFIQKSDMRLQVQEQVYPMYVLNNVNYVRLSDLRQIGFQLITNEHYKQLFLQNQTPVLPKVPEVKPLANQVVTLHTEKIYIGNVLTYALSCGEDILIPIRSLGEYFNLNIEQQLCVLTETSHKSTEYIQVTPGLVRNVSDQILQVKVVSVFWNGEALIEDELIIEDLMPGEAYPLREGLYSLSETTMHVSTLVAEIQEDTKNMSFSYRNYGQHTQEVLKAYTRNENETIEGYVKKLFPETKIIGTMKYSTKGFQKGEKVEVWAAEDGYCYYLLKNGKKIEVPWSSVSIPPNPSVCKEQVPNEVIENYVNHKQVKSKTPYFIWTDLYRQRTYVFKKQDGMWKILRSMPTSTGNNKTPTPTGEFEVKGYVPAFGMNKGYRCKNALHLFGDYLYHSVMFDVKGRYVLQGQGELGERASHGCLRLSPENSEWLYKTIPLGTKVWIK